MPRFLFLMLTLVFVFCTQEGRTSSHSSLGSAHEAESNEYVAYVSSPKDALSFLTNGADDVGGQGPLGTCASWAAVNLLEHEVERQFEKKIELSQPYLICNAERQDDGVGGLPLKLAMETLRDKGTVERECWPYNEYLKQLLEENGNKLDESSRLVVPTPKDAEDAPKYCFQGVRSHDRSAQSGQTDQDIIDFIIEGLGEGHYVAVNVPCSPELENWKSGKDTIDQNSISAGETRRHAVAISGFNNAEQTFRFNNSWSGNWGEGGSGCFTSDFIAKYASEAWIGKGAVRTPPFASDGGCSIL